MQRWRVQAHRLVGAEQCASPNQNARPSGAVPELIVIHGISLPPGEFGGDAIRSLFLNCLATDADSRLADLAGVRVSSHLLVRRDGSVLQFVPFDRRAWHAGVSAWRGRPGCNDYSIGIELEGTDTSPYSEAQYRTLVPVIQALRRVYPAIASEALVGHCDIAPGRKTDPGKAFDWPRLWRALAMETPDRETAGD